MINNSDKLIVEAGTFTNNWAIQGGSIYNTNNATVTNSNFNANSGIEGGAIYNNGNITVTNSTFNANTASCGGAIYNSGNLNIIADGGTTSFTTASDSIYSTGSMHLNTGDSASSGTLGSITFEGAIDSSANIYVNSGATLNSGTITFNNTVNADILSLEGGTTHFNNIVTANTLEILGGRNYFESTLNATSIAVSGGNTDFNSTINTSGIDISSGTVKFAADINSSLLNITGGTVTFGGTPVYYTDTEIAVTAGDVGFSDINFSGTSNLTLNNAASTLTLSNSNFSGTGYLASASVIANSAGIMNIDKTVFSNYSTATSGGVINNAGTATITNSTFSANTATQGGAIYNTGTLNIVADGGTTSFTTATDSIYSTNDIHLNTRDNASTGTIGLITFAGAVDATTANIYVNSGASLNSGTVNFNNDITAGTLSVEGGTTNIGDSSIGNINLNNTKIDVLNGTTNFNNVTFLSDSKVEVKGTNANANVYDLAFDGTNYLSSDSIFKVSSGTLYIDPTTFENYSTATNGGVINNSDQLIIEDTTFTNNSASANGGAIDNEGYAKITNSIFNSNRASGSGGAIFNNGTLSIIAYNNTTSFTGNTANSLSNAIYLAGGTVNMNAKNSGIIRFNDKINSSLIDNVININKADLGFIDDGEIIFNENVSNATIKLFDGTLTLGETGNTRLTDATGLSSSHSYLNNVNLVLDKGVLNLENGNAQDVLNLNSFTSTADSSLHFDADLSNNQNDTITTASASGTLDISHIHILNDGDDATLTLFTGGIAPTLTAFSAYTTNYSYNFTPGTAGVYDIVRSSFSGLNYAVSDTSNYRSFSATQDADAEHTLGTMGGTNSTLDIFGTSNNINGLGYGGVTVLAGQKLNIDGVGSLNADGTVNKSWNGFSSANGGGVNNDGTLKVSDSVFYNNTASTSGGAIYNTGTTEITDSTFINNKTTSGSGGAIYNASGTTTISGTSNVFTNNQAGAFGGAIYNAGDLNVTSATFGTTGKGNSAVDGGAIYNTGTASFTNTNFASNLASNLGGAIYNNGGTVNIIADGKDVSFSGNTAGATPVSNDIYLATNSTNSILNLRASSSNSITFNGGINSDSKSNLININNTGTTGTINFNNTVSNSTINLYNGTLSLARDEYINSNNLGLYGGTLNLTNSMLGTVALNNLALSGTSYLKIDADLASGSADKITANAVTGTVGTDMIQVNAINVLSDTKAQNTAIEIADTRVGNYIQLSSGLTQAEGPLYKYNLTYNPSSGSMNFASTQQFTPTVVSSQVSTMVGTYLAQTSTYNEAFSNVDSSMFMPKYDRLLMNLQNKTASADEQFVFSPTMLAETSKGLWFKQFTSFENVPLNNGPNVSNVGYGMLVGGDTEMTYLGHGFNGYLTTYAGYNGSHQNYGSIGTYQNGGLVGLTGTAYKGNFFVSLTANAGASNGNASTPTGNDEFTTLIGGTALKTGYNFELFGGKMIIQPAWTMSYTFAKTFDYTTSAGANITSDPLNAIQLSPGIKFIWNLKNGWQPYLGASMVWNVMDTSKFYANDAQLPQMSVAPYVEYGFGVQRKWGDRLTGFGQTMLRGGGRNGVALQFGFRWAIGK